MKIKHGQGYGTLTAKKVQEGKDYITISISGDHEGGLIDESKSVEDIAKGLNPLLKKYKALSPLKWEVIAHSFVPCEEVVIKIYFGEEEKYPALF